MNEMNFIQKIGKQAVEAGSPDLFPSVIIAQAILESNWGNSKLSSRFGNHFGIKADKKWKGPSVEMLTREVIDGKSVVITAPFRVYANPADSIKDRNIFLRSNKRYAKAGVFEAKTPEEQATAFAVGRYATDPNYAKKLIQLIRQYDLKKYDSLFKKKEE